MAPRKRFTVEPSTRVTRSSTRPAKSIPPESPLKKKAKKPKEKKPKINPSSDSVGKKEEDAAEADGSKKTIVVEHCKQCNSFKTRAVLVKEGLEKGLAGGVNVVLNPEKPRRGCFEIREEGDGETFISLLDMKRPFTPMKALDMDKVVSDILNKIK